MNWEARAVGFGVGGCVGTASSSIGLACTNILYDLLFILEELSIIIWAPSVPKQTQPQIGLRTPSPPLAEVLSLLPFPYLFDVLASVDAGTLSRLPAWLCYCGCWGHFRQFWACLRGLWGREGGSIKMDVNAGVMLMADK